MGSPARRAVVMPDLGDQAVLSVWFATMGEAVYAGDRLVEVLIGGATFDVPSPVTGRVAEQCVGPDEPLTPGQVLGFVDADER